MPCICGQKVDRTQQKVQCSGCKDLFHLDCVGVLPDDLDFLVASGNKYFCKLCTAARRKSIRSPPIAVTPLESVADNNNVAESRQSNLPNLLSETVTDELINQVQCMNSTLGNMDLESMLKLLLGEVAELRAENARVCLLLQAMSDDKGILIKKVDDLQSELASLRSALLNNCTSLAVNAFAVDAPTTKRTYASAAAGAAVNALTATNACAVKSIVDTKADAAACNTRVVAHTSPPFVPISVADAVMPTAATSPSCSFSVPSNAVSDSAVAATIPKVGWTNVGNKKKGKSKTQQPVKGTKSTCELGVAVRLKWVHLSSFLPTVTPANIVDYVANHASISKEHISCFNLAKKDVDLVTLKRINFKLGVPDADFKKLFSSELWPANVTVRPFNFLQKEHQAPVQL